MPAPSETTAPKPGAWRTAATRASISFASALVSRPAARRLVPPTNTWPSSSSTNRGGAASATWSGSAARQGLEDDHGLGDLAGAAAPEAPSASTERQRPRLAPCLASIARGWIGACRMVACLPEREGATMTTAPG